MPRMLENADLQMQPSRPMASWMAGNVSGMNGKVPRDIEMGRLTGTSHFHRSTFRLAKPFLRSLHSYAHVNYSALLAERARSVSDMVLGGNGLLLPLPEMIFGSGFGKNSPLSAGF